MFPLIVDTAFDCELEVDMDVGPVDDFHDLPVPNGKESAQNRAHNAMAQNTGCQRYVNTVSECLPFFCQRFTFRPNACQARQFPLSLLVLPLLIADQ